MTRKKVALIYGGNSSEWEISILSGKNVAAHIDRSRYDVYEILLRGTSWSVCDPACEKPVPVAEVDKTDFSAVVGGEKVKFDVAFLMIHGNPGENGLLQGYFEMMGIPFTTCSSFVSALTFNKYSCKSFLKDSGVLLPKDVYLRKGAPIDEAEIILRLGLPVFVKPVDDGSSFGVSKVKNKDQLAPAIRKAMMESDCVMVESYMEGTEVTVGCYKTRNKTVIFPPTEVVTSNEFFDYDAKYNGQVDEITPARISDDLTNRLKQLTSHIYDILYCNGIIRIDYIISKEGKISMLEVNTTPGMTATSFIPQQVRAAGLDIKDVLTDIVENQFV